ncbi:MAG: ABC1 kinase family protein, partial [Candidatus Binatia bacterium]
CQAPFPRNGSGTFLGPKEIDLVGRPTHGLVWLARMVVRELQITFWLLVASISFPYFWASRGTLRGALGASVALLFRRLGATFIKIGQIISTRPDIFSPDFLAPLVELQDRVPPFSYDDARAVLEEEFGRPLGELFSDFSITPVASASVAQVHRAVLRGAAPSGLVVAVKIRRPGIVRRAVLDEAILRAGARLLALVPTAALVSPVESVKHFCHAVNLQLDFRIEAENNRRFRVNFGDDPNVAFPALVESLCSDRVLTMEFVEGVKDGELDAIGCDRQLLARKGIEIICRMIYHHGFVHADLHPANILYSKENRVTLIDLGLVAELDADARNVMARLNLYMLTGMGAELARMIFDESPVKDVRDYASFERDVVAFVARVHGRALGELQITVLIGELFNLLRRHRIHADATFTVVNIAMMVAEGLGRKLDPGLNLSVEALPFLQSALGFDAPSAGAL